MLSAEPILPFNKAVTASICQFNFLPSRYIHDSWLHTLPHAEMLGKLCACPREQVQIQVSRYLLAEFGLDQQHWFDFNEPLLRIALLPGADLGKLALYAGLCNYSQPIQHTLLRAEVQALREQLGEEAYLFALKRASFLIPAQNTIGPAYVAAECREQAVTVGVCWLASAFAGQPAALVQRLLLKLPQQWQCHFAAPLWRLEQHQASVLLGKLVSELNLKGQINGGLPQT